MAFCEFPRDQILFDVTPVDNVFLAEHMPKAPGDFVRVYLYGLMLCRYPEENTSVESIAKALGLKPSDVTDAFTYWERVGLVQRMSDRPPRYEYRSSLRVMLSDVDPMESAYRYRDYFQKIQRLLGDRLMEPKDQGSAIDWIETLKLSEELALLLVESQVERTRSEGRSMRYIFRDMNTIAEKWAQDGITTTEDARLWLLRDSTAAGAARAVLKQFGLRRVPTMDEIALAQQWVGAMGLSQEEILASCAELTKAQTPTFSYLNQVLLSKKQGTIAHFAEIKEILRQLGASGTPTQAQEAIYEELRQMGFDDATILHAAGQCSTQQRHTFEDLRRKLDFWKQQNITSLADAEDYARSRQPAEQLTLEIFSALHCSEEPTAADIAAAVGWLRLFPREVILFAAERAQGIDKPIGYMKRILSAWHRKGISTLAAAKQEAEVFSAGSQRPKAEPHAPKINPAQQYAQRTYDDDTIRRVAVDITKLPGDDQP